MAGNPVTILLGEYQNAKSWWRMLGKEKLQNLIYAEINYYNSKNFNLNTGYHINSDIIPKADWNITMLLIQDPT